MRQRIATDPFCGNVSTIMRRRRYILLTLTILGMAAAAVSANGASSKPDGSGTVYKWVDNKGVVHYGDSIPEEYAQSARTMLNSQGVEVGHIEGGKSPAQQAEAAKAEELAQQRAQHDRFLLSTYLSSKDIEQLRDERLDQIDGQIRASSSYIDSLGTRLQALQERVMNFKPYSSDPSAPRMPDYVAEDLVHAVSEVRSQRLALDAKRQERNDTLAQFEADIQRYNELTARPRS
jgi:hypothetical protein